MRPLLPLALAAALAFTSASASRARAIELDFGEPQRSQVPDPNAQVNADANGPGQEPPAGDDKVRSKGAPGELPPPAAPPPGALKIELHGSAFFWYYQPLDRESIEGKPENNLELYLASLEFTGHLHDFGLYVNPRFRDSEAREFFNSNVWVEEAYAFFQRPYVSVKVGKLYNQFSRLWDDTFYGSMPYFDGFKLDSDYGVSIDGSFELPSGFGLGYYGQYFLVDGGTNGSLRDRDTVWVPNGAHRHHMAVLRAEPSFRFNDKASLRLGLAGEYMRVDYETIESSDVLRFAGDVSFAYTPVKVFGEFIAQSGQTVVNYPIAPKPAGALPAQPGRASLHNHYVVAGAEIQIWRLLARYSFSFVRYRDFPVTEVLHVPGVALSVHENVSLMVEYAHWKRTDPDGKTKLLDNSLNAIVNARF